MTIEGRDRSDDEVISGELDKPGGKISSDTVPTGADEERADVDVAVAVAADMALTGG